MIINRLGEARRCQERRLLIIIFHSSVSLQIGLQSHGPKPHSPCLLNPFLFLVRASLFPGLQLLSSLYICESVYHRSWCLCSCSLHRYSWSSFNSSGPLPGEAMPRCVSALSTAPDMYQHFPQAHSRLQGCNREQTERVPTLSTLPGAAVVGPRSAIQSVPLFFLGSSFLGYLLGDKLRSDTLRCVSHSTLLALSSLTPTAAARVWTTPPILSFQLA